MALLPEHERDVAGGELALAMEACRPFDRAAFLEGHLTPVFFGSALRNFGVRDLIDALAEMAPPPRSHDANTRSVTADEKAARRFLAEVDSATVYWNASTRFTDGFEFGYGAEIGISTDRLHARGPMGLRELCPHNFVIEGTGQLRG